jgi:cytochrome b
MHCPQDPAANAVEHNSVPVWDLPTPLFHWLLAVLVAVNVYTGMTGGLQEIRVRMRTG